MGGWQATWRIVAGATVVAVLVAAGAAEGQSRPSTAEPNAAVSSETNCDDLDTLFAEQADLVEVGCAGGYLTIDANGLARFDPELADERMMVGIRSWILRVPIPYDYDWRVPLEPQWLPEPVEASARGPVGVAINGVPIFHYEARPDVSTHIEHYDPETDTVVQGELDHCGGHSGQGEDYHYHYPPICVFDADHPTQPVGWGLDGAPIYFGEGGDDFYGSGRYSELDFLPEEPLDDCNAIQVADGGWVHYTTKTPPYVIGCHHGEFDPSLQIEPSAMRAQGSTGPYGGLIGEPMETVVTDWFVDDAGWAHLEHEAFEGGGTSAVLYRESEQNPGCWVFEYRADAEQSGPTEEYCRGR